LIFDSMQAFREVAKTSTTLLLPAHTNDPAAFVAQAVSVFQAANQGAPALRGGEWLSSYLFALSLVLLLFWL
jgi:hypothetical protein